jgi:hypothetical protein
MNVYTWFNTYLILHHWKESVVDILPKNENSLYILHINDKLKNHLLLRDNLYYGNDNKQYIEKIVNAQISWHTTKKYLQDRKMQYLICVQYVKNIIHLQKKLKKLMLKQPIKSMKGDMYYYESHI